MADKAHPISRSQFAKMAKVSPAAITKACDGRLKAACYGKRIDISTIAAQEYLADHAGGVRVVEPTHETKPLIPPNDGTSPNVTLDIPDDIAEVLDWTLRDIFEKFKSETQFSDWLKNVSMVETINDKRLKNAQKKGELISRDLVFTAFVDPLNTTHKKMLSDLAKVLSIRIPAMHHAGKTKEEIEDRIRKYMTDYIRPMKAKMAKVVKRVQS